MTLTDSVKGTASGLVRLIKTWMQIIRVIWAFFGLAYHSWRFNRSARPLHAKYKARYEGKK